MNTCTLAPRQGVYRRASLHCLAQTSSMSIERSTMSALKWASAGKLAGQLLHWGSTLLVVRLLAPEDYGLMAIVGVVTTLAAMIGDMGLGSSLIAKRELEHREVREVAGLMIVMHTGVALIVAAAAPLVAIMMSDQRLSALIAVAAIPFLLSGLSAAPLALLSKAMAFRYLTAVGLSAGAVSSVATLVLAYNGFGVWSLVLGTLGSAVTRFLLVIFSGKWIRPSFDFRRIGHHVRYGTALAGSRMIWSVVNQADVIIGARFLSAAGLGTYSVAMHIATLPMQKISSVINAVAMPAVSSLQHEPERLLRNLVYASRMLGLVSIPVLWGISSVSKDLVHLVLGEQWSGAALLIQLASLIVPLRMISAVLRTALAATGHADAELRNTITIAIVWPCCFAIGSAWGEAGLAASWLAAVPISFSISFRRMRRLLGIRYADLGRALFGPVLAGLVMYASVTVVQALLPDTFALWRLLAGVAVGGSVYVGAMGLLDRSALSDLMRLLRLAKGR